MKHTIIELCLVAMGRHFYALLKVSFRKCSHSIIFDLSQSPWVHNMTTVFKFSLKGRTSHSSIKEQWYSLASFPSRESQGMRLSTVGVGSTWVEERHKQLFFFIPEVPQQSQTVCLGLSRGETLFEVPLSTSSISCHF